MLLLLIWTPLPPSMAAATVLLVLVPPPLVYLLVSVVRGVQRGTYALAPPAAKSGHEIHKRVQLLVQVWNLPVWAGGDSDTQKIAVAAAAAAAATNLGFINPKGSGAMGMSIIHPSCGKSRGSADWYE